jgi:serine/threonine protein kinase
MLDVVSSGLSDTAHGGTLPESRRQRISEGPAWTERCIGLEIGGTYRLVDRISAGGFGHVFLAEHVRRHALSAVKLTDPHSRLAGCVLAREADVLGQLFHPNIVHIQEHGELRDGGAYLAMEYAKGIELETWLEDHGRMEAARALGILSQLASALDYLHGRGFVHADLKPSHLIIDEANGDALTLLDFGCAFEAADEVRSRDVGGTPGYMPPEQACGGRCTPAVDIYGMAAVASEMLTGQLPHPHTTRSVMRAVMTEPPALPSARGLVRSGLDEAFEIALARNPRARFSSAREFVAALAKAFANA